MSKDFSGIYGLSTKKSAMTKVKARRACQFQFNTCFDLSGMEWYTFMNIVCGHVIGMPAFGYTESIKERVCTLSPMALIHID